VEQDLLVVHAAGGEAHREPPRAPVRGVDHGVEVVGDEARLVAAKVAVVVHVDPPRGGHLGAARHGVDLTQLPLVERAI